MNKESTEQAARVFTENRRSGWLPPLTINDMAAFADQQVVERERQIADELKEKFSQNADQDCATIRNEIRKYADRLRGEGE